MTTGTGESGKRPPWEDEHEPTDACRLAKRLRLVARTEMNLHKRQLMLDCAACLEACSDAIEASATGGPLPLHNRPDGTPCNYAAMTKPNGQWVCTKCGAGGSANGGQQ